MNNADTKALATSARNQIDELYSEIMDLQQEIGTARDNDELETSHHEKLVTRAIGQMEAAKAALSNAARLVGQLNR
ncbi:MAG: hypothetical protein GY884_16445 [Proteobacteria bacterium]|nr:hypothetical protein [Pseudomonadota bacterium]